MNDIFEICANAIKPEVVDLDLPEKSKLRFLRFALVEDKIHTSSEVVRCTKSIKLFRIRPEHKSLAWTNLRTGNSSSNITISPIETVVLPNDTKDINVKSNVSNDVLHNHQESFDALNSPKSGIETLTQET